MLLQQNELRGQVMAGAFAVAYVLMNVWWFANARTVFGFGFDMRSMLEFQLGVAGWNSQLAGLFPGRYTALREQ